MHHRGRDGVLTKASIDLQMAAGIRGGHDAGAGGAHVTDLAIEKRVGLGWLPRDR